MHLDQQTLKELDIFTSPAETNSVFEYFALTQTRGGKNRLRKMFENPLKTREQIQARQDVLRFLMDDIHTWMPAFTGRQEQVLENYFFSGIQSISSSFWPVAAWQAGQQAILYRNFRETESGCREILQLLRDLNRIYLHHRERPKPLFLENIWQNMAAFFEEKKVKRVLDARFSLTFTRVYLCDRLFRETYAKHIRVIIQGLYSLDALYGMVKSIQKNKLSFPNFVDSEQPQLQIKALRHPKLDKAVPNDIQLQTNRHFVFLTGANMAGKTTFLKATALAVYLAHLGMGVPATHMELSVFDGMLTSLQNSDNLELGHSYYYSEVLRVKQAAELIQSYPKTFILMDELFRGTNYEDARQGTREVIQRLLELPSTLFILASHIYTLGAEFQDNKRTQLMRFTAQVRQNTFYFNYRLEDGVSTDTIGLEILRQEGVLEMLRAASQTHSEQTQ